MSSRARSSCECECVDCGESFTAQRSTAKYCPRCKAIRKALSMRQRPSKCPGCGSSFYRLDGWVRICVGCLKKGIGAPPPPMDAACSRCHEKGSEFYPGSPVCVECVQLDQLPHADKITRWLLEQREQVVGTTRTKEPKAIEPAADQVSPEEPEVVDAEIVEEEVAPEPYVPVAERPQIKSVIAFLQQQADSGAMSEEEAQAKIALLLQRVEASEAVHA